MHDLKKTLKLPLYIMLHPADGFQEMKYEKRGRMWIALLNMALLWLSYIVQKQYTGFALSSVDPNYINSLADLLIVAALLLLFCTANWSVTTLTDGEGSFKDIAMALGYSLTPVNLIFNPATVLSRMMVENEASFFYLLIGLALVWTAMLLFMGIYTVHNYSPGKTLVTFLFTAVAMLIIVFLLGLIFSLLQQAFIFVKSVYQEIVFRQ